MERLTKDVRQRILEEHEGFVKRVSFDAKNLSYIREYTIANGQLHIREYGKTSWADSRYDRTWIADGEEVRRFIKKYL